MVIPSKCSNQHKTLPLKKGCYSQSPSPTFKKYPNTQLKASANRFQWGPRICQDDIVNACPTKQKQPMKNRKRWKPWNFDKIGRTCYLLKMETSYFWNLLKSWNDKIVQQKTTQHFEKMNRLAHRKFGGIDFLNGVSGDAVVWIWSVPFVFPPGLCFHHIGLLL